MMPWIGLNHLRELSVIIHRRRLDCLMILTRWGKVRTSRSFVVFLSWAQALFISPVPVRNMRISPSPVVSWICFAVCTANSKKLGSGSRSQRMLTWKLSEGIAKWTPRSKYPRNLLTFAVSDMTITLRSRREVTALFNKARRTSVANLLSCASSMTMHPYRKCWHLAIRVQSRRTYFWKRTSLLASSSSLTSVMYTRRDVSPAALIALFRSDWVQAIAGSCWSNKTKLRIWSIWSESISPETTRTLT